MSLTVLKLGGSLITEKDRPLTPNLEAVRAAGRAIRLSRLPSERHKIFIVHGGGSFGHYYAKKFGLNSSHYSPVNPRAVSLTSGAMQKLHCIILAELINLDLNLNTLKAPDILSRGGNVSSVGKILMSNLFDSGLIPISFGDVCVTEQGMRVISGDEICVALAKHFDVARVVFAMDVEGIYPDSTLGGEIIPRFGSSVAIESKARRFDVTGGIARKLELGIKLSKLGSEVFFLNGRNTRGLARCLRGEEGMKATKIDRWQSF